MTNPTADASLLIDEILQTFKEAKTFCLTGHKNPDADVVGSQLAVLALLNQMGGDKKVTIANYGKPPKTLSYLPGIDQVQSFDKVDGHFDVQIVFECSGADRMGNIIDLETQVKKVINIDHHLHNPNFGHINFVDPTTSSTAEMIFKIYEKSGYPLTKDVAVCLFTGLVADTGWFRYGNTNVQSLTIASKLLAAGLPISDIAEGFYMSRTEASVRVFGWAMSNMTYHFDDKVALIKLTNDVMKQFNATGDDLEELVNTGLLRKSVQAAILVKESANFNQLKISLRSKGQVDINQVARQFGGGGHKNASGCSIEGRSIDAAAETLLDEVKKIF